MAKTPATVIDAYKFHGLELAESVQGQLLGDCPFCHKEDHFYVNGSKSGKPIGMWTCKFCQSGSNKGGGNLYTFLSLLLKDAESITTKADYTELWKQKRIAPAAAKLCRIAKSPLTGDWLFPTLNQDGSIRNIHKWVQKTNKLYGTPTCNVGLLGLPHLSEDKSRPLVIAEGHWDYAVAEHLLRSTGQRDISDLLSAPGAGGFKEEWLKYLDGRELVILVFDNDHARTTPAGKVIRPGWDGMCRIIRLAHEKLENPPEFKMIYWPDGLKHGYDIRDLFIDKKDPQVCLNFLNQYTSSPPGDLMVDLPERESSPQEPKVPPLEPLPIESWHDLLRVLKENRIFLTPSLVKGLACMVAVSITTNLNEEPLWLYLNAPPSSGKTMLCLFLASDTEHCVSCDKLTGLHSGKKAGKKDFSLIPLWKGKTVIIKDFTSVLTLQPNKQDEIFGELREIFDGESTATYRNGKNNKYTDTKFSMVAGVTDEIYVNSRAHLGERFFIIDITDDTHGSKDHVQSVLLSKVRSIQNSFPSQKTEDSGKLDEKMVMCRRAVLGYVKYLHKQMEIIAPPNMSEETVSKINSICRFIARVRAKVRREVGSGELLFRPRAEAGFRLGTLLLKMAMGIAVVLQKDEVDTEVLNIIRKISRDTAKGFHFDIIRCLATVRKEEMGFDRHKIGKRINISSASVDKRLKDLAELAIVERVEVPNNSGARGRHSHLWRIAPRYLSLWRDLTEEK